MSQLYSNPDWPKKSPKELQPQLRDNIDSSPFLLLGPTSMYKYLSNIIQKRRQGQPVSFTDFFGHLVGETLLQEVRIIIIPLPPPHYIVGETLLQEVRIIIIPPPHYIIGETLLQEVRIIIILLPPLYCWGNITTRGKDHNNSPPPPIILLGKYYYKR